MVLLGHCQQWVYPPCLIKHSVQRLRMDWTCFRELVAVRSATSGRGSPRVVELYMQESGCPLSAGQFDPKRSLMGSNLDCKLAIPYG